MEYQSRPTVDTASRAISIFSLIIALGGLALLLTQSRSSDLREQLTASFQSELAKQAQEHSKASAELNTRYQAALDAQERRNETWNSNLNTALKSFENDAQALLAQVERKSQLQTNQQRVAFRQALDELKTAAVSAPGGNTSTANNIANSLNEKLDQILNGSGNAAEVSDPADGRPVIPETDALQIVSSRLRPAGSSPLDEPRWLLVENVSSQPISITRLRFRPRERFETATARTDDSPQDSPIAEIRFQPDDNQTRTPGFHGTYDQRLLTPVEILAGERRAIKLTIADNQYAGWGFIGRLVLEYDDRVLSVDSARVVFE